MAEPSVTREDVAKAIFIADLRAEYVGLTGIPERPHEHTFVASLPGRWEEAKKNEDHALTRYVLRSRYFADAVMALYADRLAALEREREAYRHALELIEYQGRADIANPLYEVKWRMWKIAEEMLAGTSRLTPVGPQDGALVAVSAETWARAVAFLKSTASRASHPFDCAAVRGFASDCTCGLYDAKEFLRTLAPTASAPEGDPS